MTTLLLWGFGHCSETPLAWPALLCPFLLHFAHNSQGTALARASLGASLPAHPIALTRLPSPPPPSRAGGQAAGTPEGKGLVIIQRVGDSVAAYRTALANLAALVNRNRARWGWLLPEAHTRPSVIKAISHLLTEELQAGAATAGIAWGLVLGGRAGTSGQSWGGLKINDCPPFWFWLR